MAVTAYITNTLCRRQIINYRPPESIMILNVDLAPYELNKECVFKDEFAFRAFREQASMLIERRHIIVNSNSETTAKQAAKQHEKNLKTENAEAKAKSEKIVGSIEASATEVLKKNKLNVSVEKADE